MKSRSGETAKRLPVTAAVGAHADVDNRSLDMPGKHKPRVGSADGSDCSWAGVAVDAQLKSFDDVDRVETNATTKASESPIH